MCQPQERERYSAAYSEQVHAPLFSARSPTNVLRQSREVL